MESPLPLALIYASLRVQQLKKASNFRLAGRVRKTSFSYGEKLYFAISSYSTFARLYSTSMPICLQEANAYRARPAEWERLKWSGVPWEGLCNAGFP